MLDITRPKAWGNAEFDWAAVLFHHLSVPKCSPVSRGWETKANDVVPWHNAKVRTRSQQGQEAAKPLETMTERINIKRSAVQHPHYGLLLCPCCLHLRKQCSVCFVEPSGNCQIHLSRSSCWSHCRDSETTKGRLSCSTGTRSREQPHSWWGIPHQMVQHNGKNQDVFNCSFKF